LRWLEDVEKDLRELKEKRMMKEVNNRGERSSVVKEVKFHGGSLNQVGYIISEYIKFGKTQK
jgi:hypothetical protein